MHERKERRSRLVTRLVHTVGLMLMTIVVGGDGVCAGSEALEPVMVSLLEKVSGDVQTGVAGTLLSDPLVVRALSNTGEAAADAELEFTVATGGGSVSSARVMTGSSGTASVRWTLGPTVGTQSVTVRAISGSAGAVSFSATATQ